MSVGCVVWLSENELPSYQKGSHGPKLVELRFLYNIIYWRRHGKICIKVGMFGIIVRSHAPAFDAKFQPFDHISQSFLSLLLQVFISPSVLSWPSGHRNNLSGGFLTWRLESAAKRASSENLTLKSFIYIWSGFRYQIIILSMDINLSCDLSS